MAHYDIDFDILNIYMYVCLAIKLKRFDAFTSIRMFVSTHLRRTNNVAKQYSHQDYSQNNTLVLSQKLHWYYFNLVSLHCCSFISYIIHSFAHTKLRHHILTICSRLTLFKVGLIWGAGWAVFSPFALPSSSAHTTACP